MTSEKTPRLILGIESSCDETAAAVVRSGREILSSVVHSQIPLHAPFGGVVPEVAGRSHLEEILPVIGRALDEAGLGLGDIEGIAVTNRPGLIGSLLVGLSTAKGIAFARGLPLVGVHHIEAHAYAATMEQPVDFPALVLVVSGGHTALYRMDSPLSLSPVAQTLDDAAGEAFDKVAGMLGLGYPGGPAISELALEGRRDAIRFPRYRSRDGSPGFSFSGLKTAVLYHLRGQDALRPTPPPEEIERPEDVAASFEEAAVDTLVHQSLLAAEREGLETVLVAGGVACNRRLRERMDEEAGRRGLDVHFPSPAYCTDNAAMIAGLGWHRLAAGERDGLDLDAYAR
ncbi:MAG TPA: tRNA (adenosine(37)-N6)-threonylcarbamoyltransferase complex transferase subunit TsaD [Planctomycetes bacterium]|nr:tRNA (adenosine(37)-N6)-threonylcarbamoyltransferase complex transferase subunit TsaD [Planctomycetota bacterium]